MQRPECKQCNTGSYHEIHLQAGQAAAGRQESRQTVRGPLTNTNNAKGIMAREGTRVCRHNMHKQDDL